MFYTNKFTESEIQKNLLFDKQWPLSSKITTSATQASLIEV
jgi:hypothetical protein